MWRQKKSAKHVRYFLLTKHTLPGFTVLFSRSLSLWTLVWSENAAGIYLAPLSNCHSFFYHFFLYFLHLSVKTLLPVFTASSLSLISPCHLYIFVVSFLHSQGCSRSSARLSVTYCKLAVRVVLGNETLVVVKLSCDKVMRVQWHIGQGQIEKCNCTPQIWCIIFSISVEFVFNPVLLHDLI